VPAEARTGPLPATVWLAAALAVAIRSTLAICTRYTSEDYMITLRYAENLARGHGMVYNVGERVLGTTTPLYTMLLALASYLRLPPTAFGVTLNIVADGVLCLLIDLWLRREGFELAGRIAAFIVAVHPLHVQWSISGMETSLVTCAGVWALYAYARRASAEMYVVLGVLFLLRWDSLLLTGVLTASFILRERRLPLRELALFALIVAPWLIVAGAYYGNPIPITGHAKMTVYGWFADHLAPDRIRAEAAGSAQGLTALVGLEPTWLLRRLPQQQKLLNFFVGAPAPLAFTAMAIAGALDRAAVKRPSIAAACVWAALYFGLFLFSRVLLFNWYLVPPLPVIEALTAIGLARALRPLARLLSAPIWRVAAGASLAACAIIPNWALGAGLWRSQLLEDNLRAPIGDWLDAHAGPNDRILLEPIGYIGYHSHRRIVDVIGLVSPQVLHTYSAASPSPWLAQILDYKPEWCVLRPIEVEDLDLAAAKTGFRWRSCYDLVKTASYRRDAREAPLVFYVYRRMANAPACRQIETPGR
jgi:hypothetical protein